MKAVCALTFGLLSAAFAGSLGGFRENKGQVRDQYGAPRSDVLFTAQMGGLVCHIRTGGLSYQIARITAYDTVSLYPVEVIPSEMMIHRVDVAWVNDRSPTFLAEEKLLGYENFYLNGLPITNVLSYRRVRCVGVWQGIELIFRSAGGELKYDIAAAPGADIGAFRLRVSGAQVLLRHDTLILATPLGEIREAPPIAHLRGQPVPARWQILSENEVSLAVSVQHWTDTLWIDPPIRLWGTYFGGPVGEVGYACAVSGDTAVYLAGNTSSASMIATTGAHSTILRGAIDAYLARFTPLGMRVWATYYGGTGNETIYDCAIASDGNIYIVGGTSSGAGMVTPGAHQLSYGGGVSDGFIAKFSPSGSRIWGSFYGGNQTDIAYGCKVAPDGSLYIAGMTASPNNIASVGAHQVTYGGGIADGFLAKFSPTGTRLWGTYYGGSDHDEVRTCAVSPGGQVAVAGLTRSTSAIATPGVYQDNLSGGIDAFAAVFSGGGNRLWGTYFGGTEEDVALACVMDNAEYLLIGGYTWSYMGIASPGAYQPIHGGAATDGFLARFTTDGTLDWSTYYGGDGGDLVQGCVVDAAGDFYVCGATFSSNAHASAGAHQMTYGGGPKDAFLAKFSTAGMRIWGTFYGGAGEDDGRDCAVSPQNLVYLCGFTGSSSGIATSDVHQSTLQGGSDAFLVLFCQESSISDCLPLRYEAEPSPSMTPSFPLDWRASPSIITDRLYVESAFPLVLELRDISGRLVRWWYLPAPGRYELEVELPAGIYFLRDEAGSKVMKLIRFMP